MKSLWSFAHRICIAALFILATATLAHAQTVTNFQLQCIIKLDTGLNLTNSATTQNTVHYQAMTNAMTVLNTQRALQNSTATTNLSQFAIEFFKAKLTDFTNDYDAKIVMDMQKLPLMSQADKDAIRAIVNKY